MIILLLLLLLYYLLYYLLIVWISFRWICNIITFYPDRKLLLPTATRMIARPRGFNDVHELIDKNDFVYFLRHEKLLDKGHVFSSWKCGWSWKGPVCSGTGVLFIRRSRTECVPDARECRRRPQPSRPRPLPNSPRPDICSQLKLRKTVSVANCWR